MAATPTNEAGETSTIVAPWSDQQVRDLNAYQRDGRFHPFTCGACRDADTRRPLDDEHLLVATANGWTCPTCGSSQTWAWAWMADPTR